MNEGVEYAQMLEIPVSTVNVVKKKSLFSRRNKSSDDLKDRVVDSVNDRVGELPAEGEDINGFVRTEDLTLPAKSTRRQKREKKRAEKLAAEEPHSKLLGGILLAEGVAACLIAAGIFLTNIFVPHTAINTFMGNLTAVKHKELSYKDFVLTSVVSEKSNAEIAVTDEGIICFTDKTNVYPVCDGKVASVSKDDGLYTVKIAHTSSFSSVITGLDTVYTGVGDEVKANIPFAYSEGNGEVQVSMYDGDKLLNCYTLSGAVPVWNS